MRKLLKRILVDIADNAAGRRVLLRQSAKCIPIFMFHRFTTPDGLVAGHDPDLVEAALAYLRMTGFKAMSIDDALRGLVDGSLPERVVVFTIDDGYLDQGMVGAEIFIANDCPVTIYLATGLTEGTFWPVESKVKYLFARIQRDFQLRLEGREMSVSPNQPQTMRDARRALVYKLKDMAVDQASRRLDALSESLDIELPAAPPPEFAPISWQDAAALEARGVSFGGHTVRHVTLSAESDEVSRQELDECTNALKAHLQRPSGVFCYPTGRFRDYGGREIGYLKELGYFGAASAEPGYCTVSDPASRFNVLRFGFPDNFVDFKDIVLQLQRLRDRARPGTP